MLRTPLLATWTFTPTVSSGNYPAYDSETVLWQQTIPYLERFTLNHVTYKMIEDAQKAGNPVPEPTFILTPDKVTYTVNGETIDKPFNYWSICTLKDGNKGTEYMRCYSKFFNLALYQDSYIEPVYKASTEVGFVDPTALQSQNQKSASIGYLENSRNQWNNGGGGSITQDRHDHGDRLYSDFVISFDYNGKQLNTASANKYATGMIIENVTDVDTTSPLTAARQAANLQKAFDAAGATLGPDTVDKFETIAKGSMSPDFATTGCLVSRIALTKLDNKNSLEYYFGFPNISHDEDASQTEYKYHIYRAVSYVYDKTANTVTLSKPVYFEIYDMASISQGIATP